MRLIRVYPKSYKTVERVIAHSYHPDSFPSQREKIVEIVSCNTSCGFGVDFVHYEGKVDDIPKELQKKRCKDIIQYDQKQGNKWRIELKV